MGDDLTRRARYALHDMQGRVESSKLAMFEECIDRVEALSAALEKADALAYAAKNCHDRFVAWAHKPDAKKALRSLEADNAFEDAFTAYRESSKLLSPQKEKDDG